MRKKRFSRTSTHAFTLIELLAVMTAMGILSCLVVPVMAKAKQSPQALQCLNNEKQLMLAALLYVDDSAGLWFPNQPGQVNWVNANQDWTTSPANTNINLLLNPATDLFAKFIKSPRIFHCPADPSYVPPIGPHIRSVSASQAVGTTWTEVNAQHLAGSAVTGQWLSGSVNDGQNTWRTYGRASDMVAPTPAHLWVFADELSTSINDATLAVQCANTNIGGTFIDVPANYHNGAVGISFADGHAELHKWTGPVLNRIPINGGPFSNVSATTDAADVQDLNWLQKRTSAKIN